MSSLKALGIVGTGGTGVLATGLLVSNIMKTGLDWIFSLALLIFVTAGAISLIGRTVR